MANVDPQQGHRRRQRLAEPAAVHRRDRRRADDADHPDDADDPDDAHAPTSTPAGTSCTVTNAFDRPSPTRHRREQPDHGQLPRQRLDGQLEVRVKHSDRGDLAVWLVAPDGTLHKLKSSTSGDNVANLDATYTVNLSSEVRNGMWKLRVKDVFAGDTGYLDSWTLTV